MKSKKSRTILQKKDFLQIAAVVGIILVIPLVLTVKDGGVEGIGWNWKLNDFIVMATLLFSAGLALTVTKRKLIHPIYRIGMIIAIILAALLIWIQLAVEGVSQVVTRFL